MSHPGSHEDNIINAAEAFNNQFNIKHWVVHYDVSLKRLSNGINTIYDIFLNRLSDDLKVNLSYCSINQYLNQ